MNSFKVGDIVRLNSGGPNMTVREVTDESLLCQWGDGKEMQSYEFKPIMVKLIKQA